MIKLIIGLYFSACIGSWGMECRKNCSYGYHGFGRRQMCNCSYSQTCDPKLGCIEQFEGK